MKRLFAAVIVTVFVAPAFGVDYFTEELADTGSNLFNMGIQVAGQDLGGDDSVGSVNGVDFDLGNVAHTFGGDINNRNAHGDVDYFDNELLKEIMDDIVFTGGAAGPTVTFSGLTPGYSYVANFLSWDADVEGEGEAGIDKELRHTVITSSIDDASHIQEQFVSGDGSLRSDIVPALTQASFVANDSSATFTFSLDAARAFDDNAVISGATLFQTAVPEPATWLLGMMTA